MGSRGRPWRAYRNLPRPRVNPNYVHNTTVDFNGAQAKFVKLTINSNWAGTATLASLSEVRFFYVLDDAVAKP